MELRRLSQSLMKELHASELVEIRYILKDNFTGNLHYILSSLKKWLPIWSKIIYHETDPCVTS